jgi:hypothetical protein
MSHDLVFEFPVRTVEPEQVKYYPVPIRITPEDFKVSEQD